MGDHPAQRWLWITPEIADELSTGALKYSFGLAEAVAATGVDITMVGIVTPSDGDGSAASATRSMHVDGVESSFRPPWQSLASLLPNQSFACSPPTVRSRVEHVLESGEWDVLVIDGLQAAWVTPLLESRRGGARILYLAHNHESSMRQAVADATPWTDPRKLALELEARKTRRLERRTAILADVISSITDDDRSRFESDAPAAIQVVVSPGWAGATPARWVPASERPRRVGILGSFEWHVKQESLRRFLRAADPVFEAADLELQVAGKIPDEFRAELQPTLRSTQLIGWVDDAGDFLGQCRIGVVSESLGGGFKLKALDYVFNSVPLACLTHNLAGLPLAGGESAITAEDEAQLAREIVDAVDDGDLLDRYASAALERCAERFSWANAARRLIDATSTAG